MYVLIPNNPPYIQDIEFNKFNVEPVTCTYTYSDGSKNVGIIYVIELETLLDLVEFDKINRTKNPKYYNGVIVNYNDSIQTYLNVVHRTLDNRELVEKCVFSLYIYDEWIE